MFPSLGSLTSAGFSASLADRIAGAFDFGEVVITRILTTTGTLGDLTLLYTREQHLSNQDQLELFAGMVGVTLARLRTEEQNARLVQEKETLLKEVHHRIKNNMNTMTSLLSLQTHQVRGTRVAFEVLNDVRSRFRSMEILYDRLYRSDVFGSSSVTEYLQTLVRQVADLFPVAPQVTVTVDSVGEAASRERCVLDAKRLSIVGLIVNELVTNAMKYAFTQDQPGDAAGADRGNLAVTIACRDRSVEIRVQDDGPGLPEDFDPENPGGFGTTMVQAMVVQLEGTIRYESSHSPESHGTLVVLVFPEEMRG